MFLRETPRSPATSRVVDLLQQAIIAGEWPVGSPIPPDPELTVAYEVDPDVIRDAIGVLVRAGLLEQRDGQGVWVRAPEERSFDHADALAVLEVRRGLEREAARLAAERRTDADLRVLDALIANQEMAAEADNRERFVRLDVQLHRAVATASHNPRLLDLLDRLGADLDATIGVVLEDHRDTGEPFRMHTDIVAAIRERRAEDAATLADAVLASAIALVGVGARVTAPDR